MDLEAYAYGGDYYLCRPGSRAGLRWRRQGSTWTAAKGSRPADATLVDLPALPGDLQEEFLALAARAAAVGDSLWVPSDPAAARRN